MRFKPSSFCKIIFFLEGEVFWWASFWAAPSCFEKQTNQDQMRSSSDMIRIFQSSFQLFFKSKFGDCNSCWTPDRVLTVGELYNLKRFCVINIVSAKPRAPWSFTPGSLCSTYREGAGKALMTIKGQNISNFKLLLSAPPLIDKIPVTVKILCLLYSCGTFFSNLRRLLQEQLIQKHKYSLEIL